ncbi:hypothetical protein SLEP1_g31944 [Rubroshorea leprosula]|uniref:Uncharacterized protein n=1 Tax=Rubroshorea leprosula TaxID=152421 RepID=A0AAV5KBY0_9ROSI|nr:hypothetical protein SLEP1_g31944 [Rubroshorea leprosula]
MMVASDELKVLVLEEDVHFELDHNNRISKRCYGNSFTRNTQICKDSEGCYGNFATRDTQICKDSIVYTTLRRDVERGNNIFSQGIYYQYAVTINIKGSERWLVKILSLFTSVYFSCNKFEEQMPKVLGEFRALYPFNLSHNCFISLIPSSLGNLQNLKSLDLSNNNLSGEIPQQLGDLNFLAVLNLSCNQLE